MHQFSDIRDNFEFLDTNLPKNGFWGRNLKNLSLDPESASLRYYVHQFSNKTNNFEFLGPNLPKNGFWSQNFKSLSLDSEWVLLNCAPTSTQLHQPPPSPFQPPPSSIHLYPAHFSLHPALCNTLNNI